MQFVRRPVLPGPGETEASQKVLKALTWYGTSPKIKVSDSTGIKRPVSLPASAAGLLLEVLNQMSKGNAVMLLPVHKELTTHQAADILNVSRTFLIRLLEQKAIPYRMVGSHRRLSLKDVLAYRKTSERRQQKALGSLVKESEDLELY
jgi:excisionase family DNA binding protein